MGERHRESVFIETEGLEWRWSAVSWMEIVIMDLYSTVPCQFRSMTTDLVLTARGFSKRPKPVATAAKHLP